MAAPSFLDKILDGPPKLSEDHRKAVLSKSRYNRIIAGAGAGKTETLTRRIAYLLLVERVKPASIVAFTFTEKAAQSMKSRIYQRIGEIAGEKATANLGEMYVGTIHAYAKRILEDHFKFGNHIVLDDNQEMAFLMRHGWELGFAKLGGSYSDRCRNFLRSVNMAWDEMLDEKELEKKAPDFYKKLKRYEIKLKEDRLLTFGRMIYDAVLNLREHPDKLSTVKHLIVDEYQDINQAQSELISYVGKNADIFVVGDPRQSIYQWRGSDERFFGKFSTTYPNTYEVTIRENRRSVKRIVKNANTFSASFERRHFEKMDPTIDEEGFIGIASHETPDEEAAWIVDQIQALMKRNEELKFSDFGILTRSVSTSAGPLIAELRARKIPYIVGGKVGLFKRDEAQALGRIFAWFSQRGFWREDTWKRDQGTTGDDLLSSALAHWNNAHEHGCPTDTESRLKEIKLDLNSNNSTYNNFTKIYYDVLNALGFKKLGFKNKNDAAVMANLGRFNNLLTDYETANRIGGRTPDWTRELYNLCWFMNTYALTAYEEQPSDDIRGIEAVQVMTVHQAKGLEWPAVFLFATVVRRFPASLVGRPQDWCGIPTDLFDVERYEGNIEDERRLFYVAITRAREALIVSHFRRLTRGVSRSEFIDNMDTGTTVNLTDNDQIPDIQLHTGQMTDEIQTFSAGEIITYNVCPHMYLLRDLWGYQPQLNPAIGYGNGLHYCLKIAGEMIKDQRSDPVAAVATAVEDDFHMPFVGGTVLETFRNSAKSRLMNFAKKYAEDLARIEEVEYRLEYPVRNATIMGKVDVILKDGGQMEVRDYKTSEEARTFEEVSVQVRLYSAGLKSMGRPITSGSVAYLDESDIRPVDVSDPLLKSEKNKAEEVVMSIMNKKFEPNPGQSCDRCDQKNICRWTKNNG
jgi:DNA helicase-2/ATP-dependent DNA helicase PcrA